jgi:hypothetical protein
MNRSATALIVLFVGVMALLILRYDPWIYALIIGNPLITLLAVATGAALLGIEVTRRIPEHKRGVVFKGERFDHIDARGVIPLLPDETIGAEIPLDEQRVRGWPIVVYDIEHKEGTIIFAMTWRLVPTSPRPQTPRERRTMLMSDADRQRIVIERLEYHLRDIARCMTLDDLKDALSYSPTIEALRDAVDTDLEKDALTIDRLHMQRFMPTKKEDEPVAFREKRTVTRARDWTGKVTDSGPAEWSGLVLPDAPSLRQDVVQLGGPNVNVGSAAPGADVGSAAPGSKDGKGANFHEEIKREEVIVRGADDKTNGSPKPVLTVRDHTQIIAAVRNNLRDGNLPMGAITLTNLQNNILPPGDTLLPRIVAVQRVVNALQQVFPKNPSFVDGTVDGVLAGVTWTKSAETAIKLKEKAAEYKKKNDMPLYEALELAAKLVQDGSGPIYPIYADAAATQNMLKADVQGVLIGYVLGGMLSAAVAKSPQWAAILTPDQCSITAQDGGIARAVELSARAAPPAPAAT